MRVNVRDVMTREVTAVPATMPFKEVARTLVDNKISAVPVLDAEGRVAGVISEADLLRKEEFRDLYYRECYESPSRTRADRTTGYDARRKAEATTAGDLMTTPAATVRAGVSVVRAVRVMDEQNVKRLLVLDDDGRPAGIVSRGDLLRVFVRDDDDIVTEVMDEVLKPARWITTDRLTVTVADGVVTLAGRTPNRSEAELAVRMTQRVNGVVKVVDELGWDEDDLPAWQAH
ncbi:CBS domain-containing protein [Microbispora sp. NPDC049125]|uniref:CBS domain-containing protein n=1 Tax=Microbispora sp. NPDC049125 TaxID=3154929 RepID=UPI003466507D